VRGERSNGPESDQFVIVRLDHFTNASGVSRHQRFTQLVSASVFLEGIFVSACQLENLAGPVLASGEVALVVVGFAEDSFCVAEVLAEGSVSLHAVL